MSRDPYTGNSDTDMPLFSPVGRAEGPTEAEVARAMAQAEQRRDAVLRALCEYVDAWGEEPTSAEVASWLKAGATQTARTLVELGVGGKVEHAGKRVCRVAGSELFTWRKK